MTLPREKPLRIPLPFEQALSGLLAIKPSPRISAVKTTAEKPLKEMKKPSDK